MPDDDRKFSFLDEKAINAAELRTSPYDFAFVDQAIDPRHKDEVLKDAPVIPFRGSYAVPYLKCGPNFRAVVEDLESPRFRKLIERKFDIDLSGRPTTVVMMGNTTGNYNEGYAHPDSRHKIVTVIMGFSHVWPHEKGRLRVLRSDDRNDYELEFPPEFGKMLMFRVCDHSWHGFLPQKGERMSLQFCWVDSEKYARSTYFRHRLSALAKANPIMRKLLQYAPRGTTFSSRPGPRP
ncbi:MAG: 2OG-Fe(II) oxygenase [Hyphomicrobiaceae bacterium]|nr:MAG: 2OG-Fe(II) oxygenase [Hyphomicrobiaceae bacterium]